MRAATCLLLILITLASCQGGLSNGRRVGVDESWYPLEFGSRNANVTAFSTELLTEIGKAEKLAFVKVSVNWDVLMEGLQKEKYEAMLSSMPPYIFNEKQFDFSEIYLPLGPVLVVPAQSTINGLHMLNGKEIAVIAGSSSALLLENSPGVLIRYYDFAPVALNAILEGTIDGVLIDTLSATAYCRDLYLGKLKIATLPLNNEGLRMITKHNSATDLIKGFNQGLEKLKANGTFNKLLIKWGIQEEGFSREQPR